MADNDALERLSKKLNAGDTNGEIRRTTLFPKASPAPQGWQGEKGTATDIYMGGKRRFSSFELLFIGSGGFFLAALVIAGFLLFSGQNTVSTKNVDVAISGPTQIGAGNTLSLQIVVTNRNAVPMQLTDLVIEFPSGTRSDTDISVSLPRLRETLGTINPGESVNRTIKAVLFGAQDTDAIVKASVEYRVPSSNAIYVRDTTYTAHISESPAAISIDSQKEVVSGQDATIAVTVTSNSPQVLKNMLLLATYPPGFSFASANPTPASGSAIWNLGDIEPAGTRTITIHGTFSGEDGDHKVVTFLAGNQKADSTTQISAPLASVQADVTVTKPFISASIALSGSVADVHTITRGTTANGQVTWTNNLPTAVQNLSLTLSFKGQILDLGSVRSPQGFFSSSNGSILWDKSTDPNLESVAPGQSDTFDFSFAAYPPAKGTFKNPEIDLTVTVHASRASEGNVPETVNSTAETKALVATNLALGATLSHAGDSGPIPPKVDTQTNYTVSWNVSNSANALANTAVTAHLPSYVHFVGAVTPGGETVSYDQNQGIVTWNVGSLAAGAARFVSFEVGVVPSISQKGQSPVIVDTERAAGFDRFIQDTVETTAAPLSTASAVSSSNDGLVAP